MISPDEITAVGKLLKTHGINGELVVSLDRDIPEWDDVRCIILYMDGIPVPFFISQSRPKGAETDLIMLDGIESEKDAAPLCGKTVYLLRSNLAGESGEELEEGVYADDLVGFRALDENGPEIGKIAGLDTSTANYLFIIEETATGREILVPAADEFITGLDLRERTVTLSLPDGLLG